LEAVGGLVLLDLMMPEMDRFGFLRELRTKPEWHDIPVSVLTAKGVTANDRRRLAG
jgi:CheY-like chemotaxis protein